MKTEQIEQILANAPDNEQHVNIPIAGGITHAVHRLDDLREILSLRKRVQELEAQVPKWISVDERTPPIDTWILWLDGNKTMTPHGSDCHIDKINKRGECLVNYTHNYTHWMPLPQKQKGE